jgi:hypothetical protein
VLVGALVLFAEDALSLNCFTRAWSAVENVTAFVAEQNLHAVSINSPTHMLVYRFHRVTPQWS